MKKINLLYNWFLYPKSSISPSFACLFFFDIYERTTAIQKTLIANTTPQKINSIIMMEINLPFISLQFVLLISSIILILYSSK